MEEYPRLQKTRKMLDVIHRAIQDAEQHGDPGIRIVWTRGSSFTQASVLLSYFRQGENSAREIDLVEELHLGPGETLGLFRWAESEGYILPSYGGTSRSADFAMPTLDHLEGKGYELIGELPDPQERLVLIMESAIRAVRSDQSLTKEERQKRIDWFEEAKFVVRTFGVEAAKAVWRGDVPPM